MRGLTSRRWVPALAGLLGVVALAGFSGPAVAGDITDGNCHDFSGSTDTRYDVLGNIITSITTGSCLKFPSNSVVFLHGHTIGGFKQEDPTIGIEIGSSSFIWGPGNIKRFGTGIKAGSDVAIESVMIGPVAIGINSGDSYKIKEVRIRNCVTSRGDDTGMILGQGGFIESSIVRDCHWGVKTGSNNKIWNLVISKHGGTGLIVGPGNAVSRTVISSPASNSTVGLDYRGCGIAGTGLLGQGCQDGSNSVQDHCDAKGVNAICTANLNIITNVASSTAVVTDGHTNCGGHAIPQIGGLVSADC